MMHPCITGIHYSASKGCLYQFCTSQEFYSYPLKWYLQKHRAQQL